MHSDEESSQTIVACGVNRYLPDVNGYNAGVKLADWQLAIGRLVGDEHGRRKQIAEAAGMSPSQFGDLINKTGKNPQVRQLKRIADALGVPLAALFGATPEQTHAALDGTDQLPTAATAGGRAAFAVEFRQAFIDLLTDILAGLGEQSTETGRSHSDSRAAETEADHLSPRTRRAVR